MIVEECGKSIRILIVHINCHSMMWVISRREKVVVEYKNRRKLGFPKSTMADEIIIQKYNTLQIITEFREVMLLFNSFQKRVSFTFLSVNMFPRIDHFSNTIRDGADVKLDHVLVQDAFNITNMSIMLKNIRLEVRHLVLV